MSTITRPVVEVTSHVPSSWIPSDPVRSGRSSTPTTSSLGSPAPKITGPKVTASNDPSSSTPSWMLSRRRTRIMIVCKCPYAGDKGEDEMGALHVIGGQKVTEKWCS